jgi:hypothetical protein
MFFLARRLIPLLKPVFACSGNAFPLNTGSRACVFARLPGATDTAIWNNQDFKPTKEDMLTPEAVAECIRDVILLPRDRSVDELEIMPPKGVL